MRIYLADLGHDQVTISSDVYPLGVANLATYTQAYADLKQPLDIFVFREPENLKKALDNRPPDVLGLSSYAWNLESREKWGFNTRFRFVARNIGNYTGEPVIELEEIVIETPTFSFQDYLDTRVFHLLLTIYFYEGNFEEAFEFARQEGIQPFDLIQRLQSMLDQAPAEFQRVIGDFLRESQEELFLSEEACINWAKENYSGLLDGSLGGNLLSKYSMIGRFYVTQETLDFLEMGVKTAMGEQADGLKRTMLRTVIDYLRVILLHVPFADNLNRSQVWSTQYDLEAWRDGRYSQNLENYLEPEPKTFRTVVEPDRKAVIENRIATFGEHPAGLGKFTRTMFAQDLRRVLIRVDYSQAGV